MSSYLHIRYIVRDQLAFHNIANAMKTAAPMPTEEPKESIDAPLSGAETGDDEVVPGAVEEGDPLPEGAGVVALPVGYGATGTAVETAEVTGVVTGTTGMLGVYGGAVVDMTVDEVDEDDELDDVEDVEDVDMTETEEDEDAELGAEVAAAAEPGEMGTAEVGCPLPHGRISM